MCHPHLDDALDLALFCFRVYVKERNVGNVTRTSDFVCHVLGLGADFGHEKNTSPLAPATIASDADSATIAQKLAQEFFPNQMLCRFAVLRRVLFQKMTGPLSRCVHLVGKMLGLQVTDFHNNGLVALETNQIMVRPVFSRERRQTNQAARQSINSKLHFLKEIDGREKKQSSFFSFRSHFYSKSKVVGDAGTHGKKER